jgi:hypothetical protein
MAEKTMSPRPPVCFNFMNSVQKAYKYGPRFVCCVNHLFDGRFIREVIRNHILTQQTDRIKPSPLILICYEERIERVARKTLLISEVPGLNFCRVTVYSYRDISEFSSVPQVRNR